MLNIRCTSQKRSEQEKQTDIFSLEMVDEFMDMDRTARGKGILEKAAGVQEN